ncbi:MAG: NAD-dependent epimerase/dehydratase family protein [Lentisphaerae bacterium]|nr:NAD-dependent epimerase/dehydratase family protein [Lentisphaerota bacterium]
MKGKILLTGGCGFIGHHVVSALHSQGADVVILDSFNFHVKLPVYHNFIRQRMSIIEKTGYPIIEADTRDMAALIRIFKEHRPEKIVHMAAIPSAALVTADPVDGFDNNLTATRNMLEASRTFSDNIKQFIYFSSSMAYGEFTANMVTEDSPCNPINIYGASKLSSEFLIKAYHSTFNIPYTILRPSALYGPRCINRRVTQLFIEAAIMDQPLIIMDDGSDRLDFTYIDDLVQGVCLAITEDGALNETFNLTYGDSRTIIELVKLLRASFPNLKTEFRVRDKTIPRRGTLSIDKAKRKLGYRPEWPLEKGYPKMINWYIENHIDKELRKGKKTD